MSTYPAVLTPLGATLMLEGIDENLWYTSGDGNSKFYLKGGMSPLAPGVPGQDGIVCKSHSGMTPPFKHLDLQGAHQDGVTWTETVYDPAAITLNLEAHAATAQGLTQVVDEWMGAWNPRQPGTLEWITPDGGYWFANVRLLSTWQDDIKYDRRYLYRPITHKCRIDDSFWSAPDSTDAFPPIVSGVTDDFGTNTSSGLSTGWTTTYSSSHTLVEFVNSGQVLISDTGNSTQWARNLYATPTSSDFQLVAITLGSKWGPTVGGGANDTLLARWDGSGNRLACVLTATDVVISRYNSGTATEMYTHPLKRPPRPRETWAFAAGIDLDNPRTYAVYRNGNQLFDFSEFGTGSALGSSYRKYGFELGTLVGTTEALPYPVSVFSGSDNIDVENQQYYVQLVNIGTEDAYPQYTCTGPGMFYFQDGPGSGNYITLGPLDYGQVIIVTTLPRLRTVIDVTNPTNDVYPLLNGRFSTPIPGVSIPSMAVPQVIGVAIGNGTAASQILASLTPQRVHPA